MKLDRADNEDELVEILAEAFPVEWEDQGIGPYEFWGQQCYQEKWALVCHEGWMDVDVTGWEGPAAEMPREVQPSPCAPETGDPVDFVVANLTRMRYEAGRIISTWEVSER